MSRRKLKSVNQTKINSEISRALEVDIKLVNEIIKSNEQLTMLYLKHNYRVIKRGYMTLIPMEKSDYEFESHLDNNKTYHIPSQPLVRVRLGRTLLEDLKK